MVNGQPFKYTVSETIEYRECEANQLSNFPNQRLKIANHFGKYDNMSRTLRYGTTIAMDRITGIIDCIEMFKRI